MYFRKYVSIGISKKYTFLYKNQKKFDEAQYVYYLKVLSLKMFLLCSYFVRNILMLLGYFNTTLEEFKVIYPERTSYYITKMNFTMFRSFFLSNLRLYHRVILIFLFLNFPVSILFWICSYFLTNFNLVGARKFVLETKHSKNFGNFPVIYPCGVFLKCVCTPPWKFSRKLFRTAIWEESWK